MDHSLVQSDVRSRALARYAAELRFEDIPARVVDVLKMSVLDTIGCGIFGARTPWGGIAGRFAARQPGAAGIWGGLGTGAPHYVAMANATMAHGFELDDLHPGSRSHPGAVMVPLALALRSALPATSGRDMLVALAAGYEVQGRVGQAQGVSSFNRGWHPTGTAGAPGAAAAAGRLLRLDTDRMQHAIGIAGTMPAGLMAAQFGAMVKRYYVGHAAWAGMIAAEFARDGFTGVHDIFDARFGGYFAALSDSYDAAHIDDRLGERFEAGNIGVKFWPCVGTNQSVLDALQAIIDEHGIRAADVARMEVTTTAYQKLHSGWDYEPDSIMGAQMSMKFCLAMLLVAGRLTVREFTAETIRSPDALALAGRIAVTADDSLDRTPGKERFARLAVTLNDGRSLVAERSVARGNPRNPAGWEEIVRKFRQLCEGLIAPDRIARLEDLVTGLDTLEDIESINETIKFMEEK